MDHRIFIVGTLHFVVRQRSPRRCQPSFCLGKIAFVRVISGKTGVSPREIHGGTLILVVNRYSTMGISSEKLMF